VNIDTLFTNTMTNQLISSCNWHGFTDVVLVSRTLILYTQQLSSMQ